MSIEEIWLPVVGFEGRYEVSDAGRIRSLDAVVTRSNGRPCTRKGQIRVAHPDQCGYPLVVLHKDGTRTTRRVHLLVLEAHVGECPAGMQALHDDGDTGNASLLNLRWGTPVENSDDKKRHGTFPRGTAKGNALLSEGQVPRVRKDLLNMSERVVAEKHGVSRSTIRALKAGRTWRHVPSP